MSIGSRLLSLVAVALCATSALAAKSQYRIEPIDNVGHLHPGSAAAINDAGEVATTGKDTWTGDQVSFRFSHGVLTQLPADRPDSLVRDINAAGDILGQVRNDPVIWHADGSVEPLVGITASLSFNDAGQVASRAWFGAHEHAVIYHQGTIQDLGTLGGDNSLASGINNLGHVTGRSTLAPGQSTEHAFVWNGKAMKDLGTLGGDYSGGLLINDADHVVGWSKDAHGVYQAFWHDGTAMHAVPPAKNGAAISPQAMNNHDEIVGDSLDGAVIHRQGRTRMLIHLLDETGADWSRLITAHGINDAGQVVGTGVYKGKHRSYIATPLGTAR